MGGGGLAVTDLEAPAHGWDFPYEPLPSPVHAATGDLVVATEAPLALEVVARALADSGLTGVSAETLLARAPLFWTRIRGDRTLTPELLRTSLERAGIAVRYVSSSLFASGALAPPVSATPEMRVRPCDAEWPTRTWGRAAAEAPRASRWFLAAETGLAVDRARCGTGAGTRLAVIDDDGAEAAIVGFEREIPIGIPAIGRISPHGSLMAAWAVGAIGAPDSPGVAPGASSRLYVIPKPRIDVVSLPRAIAQAVFDGADVVICATYVEQTWSPMLDDALTVASQLGRRGRGTAVVMACGREGSSPRDSIHASWSLSLGDPASDPRVFCIGPSGRNGGWFLWPDRRGKLRPFANRGPAVRWLAPGDDLADPLEIRDRWCHAESSGASALAAGVILLVLGANPALTLSEVEAIVTATASPVTSDARTGNSRDATPADPFDLLPSATDADRHNAKHGYGRMNAQRACIAARDPVCAALLAIGEYDAAVAAFDALASSRPYSAKTARWIVRRLLVDAGASHAARVTLRHLRLVAGHPERAHAHPRNALARQLLLLVASLARRPRLAPQVASDLSRLAERLEHASAESEIVREASKLWSGERARSAPAVQRARESAPGNEGDAEAASRSLAV